jgi:hypothetical protein
MIAQFLKFLSTTDSAAHAAAVAELQTMAVPAPVKKRKGNPEALRKWRESQKATGKPAKAKKAKPAAAAVVPVEKPAKVKKARPAWSVKDHVTKKGVKGQIVQIGPLTAWLPAGDNARKAELFAAINNVIRSDEIRKVAAQIR